jgi:predicted metalloprotease with PDZ domain
MPFKSQSSQRLHEQLRHEIFHLWIPNAVNLTGSYDWFYEGFALYQSLKLGVAVGRIRFSDMLDTLSRAYMIDAADRSRSSLIDASRRRWVDSGITVYARGMLVAFLTDAALLDASGGKYSTDDLVKQLYAGHLGAVKTDGNTAILAAMRQHPELLPIVDGYINGSKPVEWASLLAALALEEHRNGREVVLSVALKPSSRQKALLRKLGYNSGQ